MAQRMTVKEMTDRIDAEGGEFTITRVQEFGSREYLLELKYVDAEGADSGYKDFPLAGKMMDVESRQPFASTMVMNRMYHLEFAPYGAIQFIAERDADFRAFIEKDMKP